MENLGNLKVISYLVFYHFFYFRNFRPIKGKELEPSLITQADTTCRVTSMTVWIGKGEISNEDVKPLSAENVCYVDLHLIATRLT